MTIPSPDSYRYPGEENAFKWSAIALFLVGFFLVGITAGLALFIILGGLVLIKLQQGLLQGSSIRVNATNFGKLDQMLRVALERLGGVRPTLHVKQDPAMN